MGGEGWGLGLGGTIESGVRVGQCQIWCHISCPHWVRKERCALLKNTPSCCRVMNNGQLENNLDLAVDF